MKNFLILMTFMFAVACYASPPPVPIPQFQTDELQYAPQDQVSTVFAVEYTAVADLCSCELFEVNNLVAEEVTPVKIPAAVTIDNSFKGKYVLKKPPSDNKMNAANNIKKHASKINQQNSNYGYPLTADNC
ncbi:hypothetical protein [Mangrovibacterium sp.]|uniref:hypothetical protein n=1 Tax=Mangrovibacterium sp. TaxID=1961364 RepID=UPI003567A9A2